MKVRLLLMSLAAVVSLAICLEIEVLNWHAGGILPRVLPNGGNPKWRALANPTRQLTEVYERHYRGTHGLDDDESLPEGVADQISERVSVEVPRYKAEARLRSFVGSWGLLQYPLSLLLLITGAVTSGAAKNWIDRLTGCTVTSVGCISIGMALYRAYFSGLGW